MSIVLSFEKRDKQAITFIGIQASGKTTFYNRMLSNGYYTHIDVIHTNNCFNGEHVKGLEAYEERLRRLLALEPISDSVRNSVHTDSNMGEHQARSGANEGRNAGQGLQPDRQGLTDEERASYEKELADILFQKIS